MIRAWRLCQAVHGATAFSGEGARRYGGRWNHKGRAVVVYTAATQSLAAVEYLAFPVDIPTGMALERIEPDALPPDWREEYPPTACRNLGGAWLERNPTAVLAVPSALIPAETNYLLNPVHLDFARLRIGTPSVFTFDPRLRR